MSDTTYNGWKNYETWCCKLWLDNDGADYWQERAEECVKRAIDGDGNPYADNVRDAAAMLLADELEAEIQEGSQELVGVTGMYADMLSASLDRIDFREIAENMVSDMDLYSAGWNMPGCLPDSDPVVFTNADDALEYVKENASEFLDQDAEDMTEETTQQLELEIDAWRADKSGEFGAIFRNTSYFVTKL